MKKILHLFTPLLLIILMFFSCQQVVNRDTILSGTLHGMEADSLKITYYHNDTYESRITIWTPVDALGRFSVTLPVHSLNEFRILKSRVMVKPGWHTSLNIYMNEAGKMDSTTFDGDGAKENETYNNMLDMIFIAADEMNKEPDEFIAFLEDHIQQLENEFEKLEGGDREFVKMLHNSIEYEKFGSWQYNIRRRYSGKDIPQKLVSYGRQFDRLVVFDDPELLNSFMYKNVVDEHFANLVREGTDYDALLEANKGDKEMAKEAYNKLSFNLMLDLADSLITDPRVKSYIYFNAFWNALLRDVGPDLVEPIKQTFNTRFLEVVTDTIMINYVASKIDLLDKLSPDKPAPTFSYPDATGNTISLSDFKGRYVYMDVWATWCVPCIKEMPKLKELEAEFGNDIAFVSVSIDHDKAKWLKFVEDKELKGIQILCHTPRTTRAEIMDLYMIEAIPRFIMIDPEGKIINVDASRPTDPKTRKIFEGWTGLGEVNVEPL